MSLDVTLNRQEAKALRKAKRQTILGPTKNITNAAYTALLAVLFRQTDEDGVPLKLSSAFLDDQYSLGIDDESVWFFARAFTAGVGQEALFRRVKENSKYNLLSTMDILGEGIEWDGDSDKEPLLQRITDSYTNYCRMIDTVDKTYNTNGDGFNRLNPTISLKPSNFCIIKKDEKGVETIDDRAAQNPDKFESLRSYDYMKQIIQFAKFKNVDVTIDMEDHRWTDFTVDSYINYVNKHNFTNAGIVLQTKLHRTGGYNDCGTDDVQRIIDELGGKARVRLCIGIYSEKDYPGALQLNQKPEMKQRMIEQAEKLLKAGAYLEFATHDENLIQRFFKEIVIPGGYSKDQYEIQMLDGVPRRKIQKELINGEYFENHRKFNFFTEDEACRHTGLFCDYLNTIRPHDMRLLIKNLQSPDDYFERIAELKETGVNVRLYVPYAEKKEDAIAYMRRRLNKAGDMFWNAVKNSPKLYTAAVKHTLADAEREFMANRGN